MVGGRGNKVHYGKCGSGECNCSLKPRSRFIASSGMRDKSIGSKKRLPKTNLRNASFDFL